MLGTLREKCSNTEFFSGPYFPVLGVNTGKYGPEKTLYFDIFHEVALRMSLKSKNINKMRMSEADLGLLQNPRKLFVIIVNGLSQSASSWILQQS